jgi:alpha-L-arabinofuranosidase
VKRDGGDGVLLTDSGQPLHSNNPRYAVLGVREGPGAVGIRNDGFDGIVVRAGEKYLFSVFARQMAYPGGPLVARLETKDGRLLGVAKLPELTASWRKYEAVIHATGTDGEARLVLLASHPGRIGLDMVSLFPEKTFKGRKNGMRADLAEAIAALRPRFVRFPGGCLVHGDGLDNIYHWKNSIGPVEQRKAQRNIWQYHQSLGLGYFEYFQFCEDIGAKPLPVVAAGVSCQNSGASVIGKYGSGQACIPLGEMDTYIQDVLDLIEYANGSATSVWGAKRAAAGHPEPFGLTMIGVGNEDRITDGFKERFRMIHRAVKARHPEIAVIGTAGPAPDDDDYRRGRAFANELGVEMVDEHCYRPPAWFWDNLDRYDGYDRAKAKVYLGEWAAHDRGRRNTLRAAIAEAACLTAIERNGDIVTMTSYAPLLAHVRHTHWRPDLIFFDNTGVHPTISYHVQRIFGHHAGDRLLDAGLDGLADGTRFASSALRDSRTGDLIVKLVNGSPDSHDVTVRLAGLEDFPRRARFTELGGLDPDSSDDAGNAPRVFSRGIDAEFVVRSPSQSLLVIRIPGSAKNP